jgi:hypothetical protein
MRNRLLAAASLLALFA